MRDFRAGKFTVPVKLMESGEAAELLALMKFTPISVECVNYEGVYKLMGISYVFPIVPEHCIVPEFILTSETEDGRPISVTAEKQ
jgi:hypothetical protein